MYVARLQHALVDAALHVGQLAEDDVVLLRRQVELHLLLLAAKRHRRQPGIHLGDARVLQVDGRQRRAVLLAGLDRIPEVELELAQVLWVPSGMTTLTLVQASR